MFAVGTDEVIAPESTRSVSTTGSSVSSVSTVAPHVSPWLQAGGAGVQVVDAVGDVQARLQQRVDDAAVRLVQVDDVRARRVGAALGGERGLGHRHAAVAGDQQLQQTPDGRRGALTLTGRDDVRARERRALVDVLRIPAGHEADRDVLLRLARPATAEELGLIEDQLVAVGLDVRE